MLNTLSWFSLLSSSEQEWVISQSVLRVFHAKRPVLLQGQESEGLYGVRQGALQFCRHCVSGNRTLFSYVGVGHWMGELGLIDKLPSPFSIYAHENSELLIIPNACIYRLLKKYPEIYEHLAKLLCTRTRILLEMVNDFSIRPLRQQLANRLLLLIERHGLSRDSVLNLRLSQEEMGAMLGVSRQSIHREVKRLQEEELIHWRYGRIKVLDHGGLINAVSV